MNTEITIFDEEEIIERAKKQFETKNKLRRIPLIFGLAGLGSCLWIGTKIIAKLEDLPKEELAKGFVTGFALSIIASTMGIMGAICITKALIGFADDFKIHELLLIYHKRLYKNKKLKKSEPTP